LEYCNQSILLRLFYIVSALLANNDLESKIHAGTKVLFNEHFLKEEIFDKDVGRFYATLFDKRQESDYTDLMEFQRSDVTPYLSKTSEFVTLLKKLSIKLTKISSLNLNGIRAAQRKGFTDWVSQTDPDYICLQELRAHEHQIPEQIQELNYHKTYHTAQKKGYSGVGILSKEEPISVKKGIGVDWIHGEGRVLMAEFDDLFVCSLYAPSGTTGDERQDLKMEFLDVFLPYATSYLAKDKSVAFCGDFNICHQAIDIHNPTRLKSTSGFLPEERKWVSDFLNEGFKDVYRGRHKSEPDLYSWWSYRAASKERNKGWRIDYHLTNPELMECAREAVIQKEWDMSDHAPVTIEYAI